MKVSTQHEPGVIIATVEGRFDAHTVDSYVAQVAEHVNGETPHVIADLSGVEFMDSSALAALVTTLKRTMQHDGEIVLAGASGPARIILELTRLDQVFLQAASVDAARAQLSTLVY
jgi:anti-sigma B factor antagonist